MGNGGVNEASVTGRRGSCVVVGTPRTEFMTLHSAPKAKGPNVVFGSPFIRWVMVGMIRHAYGSAATGIDALEW